MFDNKTRSIAAVIIAVLCAIFGLPQLTTMIDQSVGSTQTFARAE